MHLPFRAISVFHAVSVTGSIRRAAEQLGVTPSAVSQQIDALELHLGTSLVAKSGRRLVLTEAGERYFQMIDQPLAHVMDATDGIRGYRSAPTLTVRASPSLASKWLLPRLQSFLDAQPELEVRIDGTSEQTDFDRDSVDVELRHGEGAWPGLFVEAFAEERFSPVCAPSLHPPGALAPEDLLDCRLIHSVKSQVQWGAWFAAAGVRPLRRWRRVSFDRTHMAIDAASSGMGVALESDLMTWRELGRGSLACPVRDPPLVARTTQWIVCPPGALRQRKTRVFLDWLREQRALPGKP